jgi:hypothetical protein
VRKRIKSIDSELANAKLPDKRLVTRLNTMYNKLSASPANSLPQALNTHAEVKGAYRFFSNPDISWESILNPHFEQTLRRINQHEVVLVLNDSTDLDYKHMQKIENFSFLNDTERPGCTLHSLLAFTPKRLCLGNISATFVKRDAEKLGKKINRKKRSVEEKETYRWVEDYRKVCELAKTTKAHLVYEADREADFYEMFCEYASNKGVADFIIRGNGTRLVYLNNGQEILLQEALKNAQVIGYLEFFLPSSRGRTSREVRKSKESKCKREARVVKQKIKILSVTCKPPRYKKSYPPVKIEIIYLEEIDPPVKADPVNWLLFTSLAIKTLGEAKKVVDYYLARWGIETFFHVLKTGCQIERLQFEEGDRLLKCVALYLVVAWRILYMMGMGRDSPDVSCDVIFEVDEWECAYAMIKKKAPPKKAISLGEMIKLVGQLGGHLGRTRDGPAGPKAMWKGIQRVYASAEGWKAHKEITSSKSFG